MIFPKLSVIFKVSVFERFRFQKKVKKDTAKNVYKDFQPLLVPMRFNTVATIVCSVDWASSLRYRWSGGFGLTDTSGQDVLVRVPGVAIPFHLITCHQSIDC